jgi:glycolate oxidase iron-sulfur subunit
MLGLAPERLPPASPVDRPQVFAAAGERRARIALLSGCAQQVLAPEINEATVRLLTRHGVEVVIARGAGCCGALVHHMGQEAPALAAARANIDAWERERADGGLDAVIINASGCGTTVKDYGFMLREDARYAEPAARIAALAQDVTEFLHALGLQPPVRRSDLVVAYHSACSMQHGQRVTLQPKELLRAAGFTVEDIPEGHICCGSAGTYNLLQPELAARLRARKLANIARVRPDVVATGNIGCIVQLADGGAPVVHTVELLDWATGGPAPRALAASGATAPAAVAAAL